MNEYCIITTACNKKEIADKITKHLLTNRLAACCQVFPIQSSYWWEDEIVEEMEYFIQIKTKKSLFETVKEEIIKVHDYDVCEVASYDITNGSEQFLNWIDYETK